MKKLIAMGLTVIMTAVAVCGCGSSDSVNDAKKSDNQTKQQAVKVIDVDLTSEEYAFGVDKNKPELLTQVNDFIKEIKIMERLMKSVTNILVAEIQHR